MNTDEKVIFEKIKKAIDQANNIVCVMGLDTIVECGGINLWDNDNLYRIEKTYGLSPEEMLSAGEFATRKERFYDFYKKEILGVSMHSGPTYEALKILDESGKLKNIISVNIYGMEKINGLKNVVELGGNIHHNYCPVCKKKFPVEYLLESKAVPICNDCKEAIRPNIRLLGERVQNDLYTKAAIACSEAEVILVLGTNLHSSKVQYCTGHYKGNQLILINEERHFTDKFADCVYYDRPMNVLPKLVEGLKSNKS